MSDALKPSTPVVLHIERDGILMYVTFRIELSTGARGRSTKSLPPELTWCVHLEMGVLFERAQRDQGRLAIHPEPLLGAAVRSQ